MDEINCESFYISEYAHWVPIGGITAEGGCFIKKDKLNAVGGYFIQVQRESNSNGGRNCRLKPVKLSSVDEAVKQEAIGSLAR